MIASGKISEAVQRAPGGDTALALMRRPPRSPIAAEALTPQAEAEAQAQVLPWERSTVVEGLRREAHVVAMVKASVNALAVADVGIAIGNCTQGQAARRGHHEQYLPESALRRTILLLHRCHRVTDAVRPVSPGGLQFVAWVGICISMILAAFGDGLDPAWIGEAGLEVAMFDLAGEFSVLTMQHWHLLLLLGAAALAASIAVLRIGRTDFNWALRPTTPGRVEKVPITL